MEFIQISVEEKKLLATLEPTYQKFIEQFIQESEFLFALLCREKPSKVLEVGVSTGASSVIISHALSAISPSTTLYSVDYAKQWYVNPEHPTGFLMNVYPFFKQKWKLYTGNLAASFMDGIGKDIDFVFLDTSHCMPGEILDFLMILPYLKDDCLLVVHDVNLQTAVRSHKHLVNNILMNCIASPKILPRYAKSFHSKHKEGKFFNDENITVKKGRFVDKNLLDRERHSVFVFPNIGAVRINQYVKDNIYNFFNALALPWEYIPSQKDFETMQEHFKKHYDAFYCNIFETSYHYAQFKSSFDESDNTNEKQ